MRRRVAIVGARPPRAPGVSRQWDVWLAIERDVRAFLVRLDRDGLEIVSGGALGVDSIARAFARSESVPLREHLPDYDRHGIRAPLLRNALIVKDADEVHAWPAPWSRGTHDTIGKAREAGKKLVVHEPWRK